MIRLEDGMGWDDWSNQIFPTSFKDDCDYATDNEEYENWTYYLMSEGSVLTGTGNFEGTTLTLSHLPGNFYYGYQVGNGANNVSGNYGNGGWFSASGTVVDIGNDTEEDVTVSGDFAFEADCCPQYGIERTWTATDCSGNSIVTSQTISFIDIIEDETEDPEVEVETEEESDVVVNTFPNPAVEILTVEFAAGNDGNVTVDIISPAGGAVKPIFSGGIVKNQLYTQTVDISDIQSGIYFVRVVTSKGAATNKVVITNR